MVATHLLIPEGISAQVIFIKKKKVQNKRQGSTVFLSCICEIESDLLIKQIETRTPNLIIRLSTTIHSWFGAIAMI